MKELFLAFLAKTLNIATEEAAGLLYKSGEDEQLTDELKEDALAALLSADAKRVETVTNSAKEAAKAPFDNGFKKGNSETARKFEGLITQLTGFQNSDLRGEDLVKAALAHFTNSQTADEEKVKLSSPYIALEQKLKESLAQASSEKENALNKLRAEFEQKETLSAAQKRALSSLSALNPVNIFGGENKEQKFDNLKRSFLNEVVLSKNWKNINGEFIQIDENGQRVNGPHGHAIKLNDLVNEAAKGYFDFQVQSKKGNGGNVNEGGEAPFNVPKTEADYHKAIFSASNSEERAKIKAAFEAAGGAEQV